MKVKQLILGGLFFLVSCAQSVKAQDLDELNRFKYAIVETLFYEDMEVDKYSISGNVRKHFLEKGYTVVTETKRYWPEELFKNPCMGLYVDITASSGFFTKYKVLIEMKDCNDRVLYSKLGKGTGETETDAYRMATDWALHDFDNWQYQYTPGKTVELKEELTNKKIEGLYDALGSWSGLKIRISTETNQKIEARVVVSGDNKYKKGQILAVFKRSSLDENLFNVTWLPGNEGTYETLASLEEEGGRLTVEIKEKGQTKQLVFRKIE